MPEIEDQPDTLGAIILAIKTKMTMDVIATANTPSKKYVEGYNKGLAEGLAVLYTVLTQKQEPDEVVN